MSYKNYDKVIFVHIPRTGGTSVRSSLQNISKKYELDFRTNHQYLEDFNPGEEDFIFSFVRNPYERLISWYNFHHHHKEVRGISFSDWVKGGFPTHWEKRDFLPSDALSQHKYFIRNDKNPLNFLGKHENLKKDFYKLLRILNLEIPGRFPHHRPSKKNKEGKNNIYDYYDKESIEIVNEKFSKDFELFGYKKIKL